MKQLILGLNLILLGCQAASPAIDVWWSPKLGLKALSEIDSALTKAWEDTVAVQKGGEKAIVTNCATSLDLLGKGYQPPSDRDYQALRAMSMRCLVLRALKGATPPRQSTLSQFRLDEKAVDILPPSLGVVVSKDDERRLKDAEAKGQSWKAFEPGVKAPVSNAGILRVEGDGWSTTLEIYARADFDGDGFEDVLLSVNGSLSEGSYSSARMVVLTRLSGERLHVLRELTW
jgi:hypothetical protein